MDMQRSKDQPGTTLAIRFPEKTNTHLRTFVNQSDSNIQHPHGIRVKYYTNTVYCMMYCLQVCLSDLAEDRICTYSIYIDHDQWTAKVIILII